MKTKRILLILGSLLIYVAMLVLLIYFEHDTNESLRTLWDAIWYSIITVSTVGYGDSFPVTTGGKIVGIGFVIISVGFLGILISKISYYLIEIGEKKKMGYYGTKFENHVVILGWNSFTKMIAEELLAAGQQVAVIMDSKDCDFRFAIILFVSTGICCMTSFTTIVTNNYPALKAEGFMTRDPREIERKKPGQKKARKKFQFSKR